LKNQIYRGKEKVQLYKEIKGNEEDTFSVISKKNRYSNALIEKASKEMKHRKQSSAGTQPVSHILNTIKSTKQK
jgi:hypothetical protein